MEYYSDNLVYFNRISGLVTLMFIKKSCQDFNPDSFLKEIFWGNYFFISVSSEVYLYLSAPSS